MFEYIWFVWTQVICLLTNCVVVKISNGHIKGTVEKKFCAFKGIRYAAKPTRFEPSKPPQNWKDIYDASYDKPACVQSNNTIKSQNEDCLFLSVYTPRLPWSNVKKIPVMFWIYGGAFSSGSSLYTSHPPDYFINEDVIIVTINYRLGIFGFLSSGDEVIPGNNGMKDIILGLKWVQKNIRSFGGDPSKVTVFGESAGAVLTSLLTISPLTEGKGYFKRAICQSGNALAAWSLQRNPKKVYKRILSMTGCADKYCLQKKTTSDILTAQRVLMGIGSAYHMDILNGIVFAPVHEQLSSKSAVINGSYSRLYSGVSKIPSIMGINSGEGRLIAKSMLLIRPFLLQADFNPRILVPHDMYVSKDAKLSVAWQIKNYYFKNVSMSLSSDANIIKYVSANMFEKSWREYFTIVGNVVPSYCYVFSYKGAHGSMFGPSQVGHAEELSYFWGRTDTIKLSRKDISVKNKVVRLWTNFAKYGVPTPNFDPLLENVRWPTSYVNPTRIKCLNIDNRLDVVENPKDKDYQFWKFLYDTYGNPQDTY